MATIHHQVMLPEDGNVFCFGPRPKVVEIREVPEVVSDKDLKQLLDTLCTTPEGLQLGSGEGFERTAFNINYLVLCRQARKAGIAVSEAPENGAWPPAEGVE